MEIGITSLVAIILAIFFFKSSIRQIAKHTENVITTEVNEATVELIERNQEALDELYDRCGTDFKSVREVYSIMNKRGKANKKQNP